MARYGMVIEINKCSGCYNCMLACKDEHCGHDYPGYAAAQPMTGQFWMKLHEQERGRYPKIRLNYTPVLCMHCQDASCVNAAQDGAVYRRADGIVLIDPEKAKGRKQLINSCPYRLIYWNENQELPQKCTLCAHLLDDGWKLPRCVELCPTGALTFGDLDDPESDVSKLIASGKTESLHPEYGLKEQVVYMNVPKKFVAGTVVYGDTDECAKDVTVTLRGDGASVTAQTDGFGDFEFEGLAHNADYRVSFEASGYKSKEIKVRTSRDVYLEEVLLVK